MRLTKAQLKKAIKKEKNLQPGAWVEVDSLPAVGDCAVCAVGAVLRHGVGLPNNVLDHAVHMLNVEADSTYKNPDDSTDAAYWLSQMSGVFESQQNAANGRKAVLMLIDSKEFPKTITIPEKAVREAKSRARRSLVRNADDERVRLFGEERSSELYGDPSKITTKEFDALRKLVIANIAEQMKAEW